MEKITAPRGTKDVLPDMTGRWQSVEQKAMETASVYGYRQIRFPTFEHTELFVRGVGDTTDIVQKEMYTFNDKGGRSITLRPEGTASVVRACTEHGLFGGPLPLKVYYIAPNFRYEKPQSGRLREHHQFGVECFGAQGPEADAEVISLAHRFLNNTGIDSASLRINSIGCPSCRARYREALLDYLRPLAGGLCNDCKERLSRNPLRVLDCKSGICRETVQNAPVLRDSLCDDCRGHHAYVQTYLKQLGISFELDDRIVRGLDYYNRTVFEFVTELDGSEVTVLGGGRYDGLAEQLGGPKTPACGFGCGLERLLMVQDALGNFGSRDQLTMLFVAAADSPGSPAGVTARMLVNSLRNIGMAVEQDLCGRSLKAQFKHADRLKANYVMVIGGTEVETAQATVKRMSDGHTFTCALDTEAIQTALFADFYNKARHDMNHPAGSSRAISVGIIGDLPDDVRTCLQ